MTRQIITIQNPVRRAHPLKTRVINQHNPGKIRRGCIYSGHRNPRSCKIQAGRTNLLFCSFRATPESYDGERQVWMDSNRIFWEVFIRLQRKGSSLVSFLWKQPGWNFTPAYPRAGEANELIQTPSASPTTSISARSNSKSDSSRAAPSQSSSL